MIYKSTLILLISGAINATGFSFGDFQNTTPQKEDDILPMEEAFIPEIQKLGDNQFRLTWEIKENYYMYQDKSYIHDTIAFFPEESIEKFDENFDEKVHVFYNFMDMDFETEKDFITVTYQGCAEDRICYLPKTQQFSLQ